MGNFIDNDTSPPARTPGVMIVRPSLHEQSKENAATFKRWTVMHFRDLLNLSPSTPDAEGISRTMRYTNAAGDLFYTIHSDNISIWKTPAYYAVSRRLDLENTRKVEEGEEAVLSAPHSFGDEPMVWQLVNAEFGIFSEHAPSRSTLLQVAQRWLHPPRTQSYQSVPLSLLSAAGEKAAARPSLLVTFTYNGTEEEMEDEEPPKRLRDLQDEAVNCMARDYGADSTVWTSIYRHIPNAQPDMHPLIVEGADGRGSWVVCVLVESEVSHTMRAQLQVRLDDSVEAKRAREDETRENVPKWRIKVGIWRGELFMS